jgi:hypothetical protein
VLRQVRISARHDPLPHFGPYNPGQVGNAMAWVLRDGLSHLQTDGKRGANKVRELSPRFGLTQQATSRASSNGKAAPCPATERQDAEAITAAKGDGAQFGP